MAMLISLESAKERKKKMFLSLDTKKVKEKRKMLKNKK